MDLNVSNPAVANSSFETPTESGTFQGNPSGGSWTFNDHSGIEGNGSAFGAASAPDGTQAAFIQGFSGQPLGIMSQVITFANTGAYTITFQAARRSSQVQPLNISIDGTQIGSNISPTSSSWLGYTTATFNASAGTHTLSFSATDNSSDKTAFVDQVSITRIMPQARDYFTVYTYDAADRPVQTIDLGTNGGTPFFQSSAAPTVANFGFDTPALSSGTIKAAPSGASWVSIGSTNHSGIFSNGSAFGGANAPQGTQAAFLQIDGTMLESISNWDAGVYAITVAAAQRPGQHQDFDVIVDGNIVAHFTPTGSNYADYTTASFTLTTGGSHTLEFKGLDTVTGDNTAFLDNVRVNVVNATSVAGVMITANAYNAAGWTDTTTDPRGIVAKTLYDMLGETTASIANYNAAVNSGLPSGDSTNVTVAYTYDGDGNMLTQTAYDNSGTAITSQVTAYVYGISTNTGSLINSNDVLAATEYPDPTTGAASTNAAQVESYTYDALGEQSTMTDRNGTTHTYAYDALGRMTSDTITTLGSGVNGAVLRLGYTFNTQGLPYQQTSYSDTSGTSIVNQVQDDYNGLGQMTAEYQEHSGAVVATSTASVQYAYSDPSTGSRLTSMTYPNGRVLDYGYDNNALDDAIGRLDYLADSAGTAAGHITDYQYLGLSTPVLQADANGVTLSLMKQPNDTLASSDGGDQYTGLDRFGRVIDQNWVLNAATTNAASTDRFQYGYDADGNVLYKNNILSANNSELYHASGTSGYDALNRLTGFYRGSLTASVGGGMLDTVNNVNTNTAGSSQTFGLDALGNTVTGSTDGTDQSRSVDAQNQIDTITSNPGSNAAVTGLGYDNDGNTLIDDQNHGYVYDAWNRQVAVTDVTSGDTLETYAYNANGERIQNTIISSASATSTTAIATIGSGASIKNITNVNGKVFFAGNDGTNGVELWVSDGTTGGTVMVKDINPGSGNSNPANLTAVGDLVYFTANDGTHGTQLWVSDGTSDGTIMVTSTSGGANPHALTDINGTLYFGATDSGSSDEVWKASGSTATEMTDSSGLYGGARQFTYDGGIIYYVDSGGALCKTDGSSVSLVGVDGSSGAEIQSTVNVLGTLYFLGGGRVAWNVDTSGGSAVTLIGTVDTFSSSYDGASGIFVDSGTMYFYISKYDPDTDTYTPELWKTDGTDAGTILLGNYTVSQGLDYNGTFYFTNGDGNLYKTDGTAAGTVEVVASSTGVIKGLLDVGGSLYFTTCDTPDGTILWRSDGTSAGTSQVETIDTGGFPVLNAYLTDANGTLYLVEGQDQLVKLVPTTTTTDLYYSNQWQVVEEQQSGIVQNQYVWSPFYVNQMVLRDHNSTGSGDLGKTGSGLAQRLYVQQDANYNVTALVNTSGTVVERFIYTPYGEATVLNADWSPSTATFGEDVNGWVYGFQGMRIDTVSCEAEADGRNLDVRTGTWDRADPIGYGDGPNRYQCEHGAVVSRTDPSGLQARPPTTGPKSPPTTGPIAPPAPTPWKGPFTPVPAGGASLKQRLISGFSVVDNKSSEYVLIWNSKGYGYLPPRTCTSKTSDDGDWVRVSGVWYKVPDGVTAYVTDSDPTPMWYELICVKAGAYSVENGGIEPPEYETQFRPMTAGGDINGWTPPGPGPTVVAPPASLIK